MDSEQEMFCATFVCLLLLLCLLLGLGTLETWKQERVLMNPDNGFVVEAAATFRALLGIQGTAWAAATTPSAAVAEDDDEQVEQDDGKKIVATASGSASTPTVDRSVQSNRKNDAPTVRTINSTSGALDEHTTTRVARRSNRRAGGIARRVKAPRELELNDTHLFLDLERKAVTGRLRIEEIPRSIPRLDILGDRNRSQPPVLAVPNSPRMPVSIADVSPPLEAEAHPKRQESATAGFSDDDLALPSATKRNIERSTSEGNAPLLAPTKPSVNQVGDRSASRPTKAVTPSAPTLDVTQSPPATVLNPNVDPTPSLAKTHSRARTPLTDPQTTTPQPATRSTDRDPVPREPESEAMSTTPQAAEAQIHRPEPRVMITRQMLALKPRIESVLRFYFDKPLNTRDDSAWSVMHSILGYGVNAPLAVGNERGRRTNAVGWMCWNNPCRGQRLLYLDDGYIVGREGPGFQGHPGQFLAMLAQVRLTKDYPLRVQGQHFTVEDLIEAEKRTCGTDKELTFKLIALSHYLESEAEWLNERGETWNIAKMLQIEMAQPVNGAACGGTHRVMACCYPVLKREQRGEPLYGAYLAAKKYMRNYQRYAMRLQNRDGSFSSDWFKRRSNWGDMDRQLQTTGHILEWLIFTLPRNELSDPRIVRATQFLTNLMIQHRYHDWEVGPRGHALRALKLFQQRVFQSQQPLARTDAGQVN